MKLVLYSFFLCIALSQDPSRIILCNAVNEEDLPVETKESSKDKSKDKPKDEHPQQATMEGTSSSVKDEL